MKNSSLIWLIVIIVVVVLAGFWIWSANSMPSATTAALTPTSTSAGAGAPTAPATVVLASASTTKLGAFLVAANGMTLYKYTPDTPGVSNCTGGCAAAWPPYTVSADVASTTLGGATTDIGGQIGTITRADGTLQVTYNNMPLYFYANDKAVGDTKGQNVGGIWFVVAP